MLFLLSSKIKQQQLKQQVKTSLMKSADHLFDQVLAVLLGCFSKEPKFHFQRRIFSY